VAFLDWDRCSATAAIAAFLFPDTDASQGFQDEGDERFTIMMDKSENALIGQ
jgi:hypothetical protein